MSEAIKIAFIGAGKQAQCVHLPNYASLENVKIAAIVDGDADLARAVAQRHGAAAFGNHREMLAAVRPDAVMMTLRAIPEAELIIKDLLQARVPVLTEKPLAWSVQAGERIVAEQRRTGTPLFVGYHRRSDPAVMYARERLSEIEASQSMGPMRSARIHVSLAGDWIANAYAAAIKGRPVAPSTGSLPDDFAGFPKAARNAFTDFSYAHSHQLDFMRHLIGPYRISYVDPTRVLLVVTSARGVPGVFEFTPYKSSRDWREHAIVGFERGYVRVDVPAPLAMNRAGTAEVFCDAADKESLGMSTVPVFPSVSAMTQQARNFIRAVRGEQTPLCSAAEALESLTIAREWAISLVEPAAKAMVPA